MVNTLIKRYYVIHLPAAMKFAYHRLLGPFHHPNHAAFQPAVGFGSDHLHFHPIAV